jgi:hypothetical protein
MVPFMSAGCAFRQTWTSTDPHSPPLSGFGAAGADGCFVGVHGDREGEAVRAVGDGLSKPVRCLCAAGGWRR